MRRTLSGLAAAGVVLALAGHSQAAIAAAPQQAGGTWSIVQTNMLPGEDGIRAISVAPTTSTWAGGYQTVNGKEVPLVQHLLDGKWTTAKSPSSSLGGINALAASSSKNVWAFGHTGSRPLAARWNGTKWTTTTMTSSAYDVSDAWTLGATNVWAVGDYGNTRFALHWNGASWKKITMPVPAHAIAGVTSTHVYAVGSYKSQPAVEHWTGSAWVLAKTPKLKPPNADAVGSLNDIYAPATDDIWAAGGFDWSCGEDGDDECSEPFLLHWNGKAWSTEVFHQIGGPSSFTQITGDGAGGLWLNGSAFTHIVGDTVTTVARPRSGGGIGISTMAAQGTTVWAAGTTWPAGDPDDPTGNGIYLRTG